MATSTKTEEDLLVNFLKDNFTSDFKSLEGLDLLREEYKNKICSLQEKITKASKEIPSEIDQALSGVEGTRKQVDQLEGKVESLCHDISDHTHAIKPMVGELNAMVEKIRGVERHAYYLSMLAKIEDISSQIQASLMTESLSPAVDSFHELTDIYTSLQTSSCSRLLNFLKETILFWNKILKDRIAVEFEEILKALRWPLVATTMKAPPVTNVKDLKERMRKLFLKLLSLQLPDTINLESTGVSSLMKKIGGVKPLLLPLDLMLKPLRKRFKYHFYGQKQTNSLDKPEWYLTQVLSWIRDHSDFLDRNIQPILDEAKRGDVCARMELTRGLVLTVMEKMYHDLPELAYEEANFSHLVDEALSFDAELRNTHNYPPILPGCLDVLCLPDALSKWLIIEKKFAMQKIEQMLNSPTCWESQYRDIADLDEVRVPECAESFMMLLQTITDRYRRLPVSDAKLQFLGLQLELLEDFRMRLVQVMKTTSTAPTGHILCAVLNAVHYISQVLRDWSELTFFLQLLCYKNNRSMKTEINESVELDKIVSKKGLSEDDSFEDENLANMLESLARVSMDHTVFEEITSLFEGMQTDMISAACNYVFVDVQARSQPYRKDRWISLPTPKELSTTLGLSASACEMFLVLKDHLSTMEGRLSKQLFDLFWQRLAQSIDEFIFAEVIIANHFNDGGAVQLQFDITRNLVPLFGEYTNNPDSYIRLCKEASTLLTLKSGSALMLKELVYSYLHDIERGSSQTSEADVGAAMRDVGVFTLSAEQCESILSLRTNLSVL